MSEMDERELAQVTNCAMCANMCKHSCPAYLASGSEKYTPQKIARLILYEEKEFIEDRHGFCDVVFHSAMCGACSKHCIYEDYDLRKYIQKGRRKAFNEGMLPDATRRRVETFKKYGNPNGERQLLDEGTGGIGYFVACSAYQDNELLPAMERIIAANGEQIHRFGGADLCCGAPLYYAGDMKGFEKAAVKMAGEIETRKLKKVIIDCPNCLKIMTDIYLEVGAIAGVDFVHTTEYINDLIEEGRIKVNGRNGTATYHDPCILANDLAITEAPRKII
ncbi:MAG: (Fe-S)-binding protein, partial [Dehalococcoidia bacterium]